MKKRKNKIPAFIPNRPSKYIIVDNKIKIDEGETNEIELKKQRDNQRKLMLNNKNHKY